MKLKGILGKGTGKLGNAVFAVSGGEQIMREYNPNVSNPNTEAQVAQRAKLKLMSQLAAALAPAFGFAKQGLVSARNQFVSKNIGLATFAADEASVDVTALQLTPSNVAFPALVIAQGDPGEIDVELNSAAAADIKRVAYFVYRQNIDKKLEFVATQIVDEAGASRTFATTFENVAGKLVVYAYGIKDNSVSATIRYENYVNAQSEEEATLSVISLFRSADYSLTATTAVLQNNE